MVAVELGHRGPAPRHDDDPHNRLLHLAERGLVAAIECRLNGGGWRAGVVASRAGIQPSHIELSDADVRAASTRIDVDPAVDPEGFALLWQVRVCQQWRGGHVYQVARTMAGSLRRTGTLVVDLDATATRRLAYATRLRPPAIRIVLARLVDAHLLAPQPIGTTTIAGSYQLTMPGLSVAVDASQTGSAATHPGAPR